MKKLLPILVIGLLFLTSVISIGINIYLYSKYTKDTEIYEVQVSDLQSQGSEKENTILDLKDLVKSAEVELKKDLNGDEKIGDLEIEEEADDASDDEDLCRNVSSDNEFIVTKPCTNERLDTSFTIKGRGRIFEAQFSVRIKDEAGNTLYTGNYMTEGGYKEELDAFEDTVTWTPPAVSGRGTIEFFDTSMIDGSEIIMVSIPIRY